MLTTETCSTITQALANARSPAPILFLLTAYFDALGQCKEAISRLQDLVALPLRDSTDVAARHARAAELDASCLDEAGGSSPLIAELRTVTGIALRQLQRLEQGEASPAEPAARATAHAEHGT